MNYILLSNILIVLSTWSLSSLLFIKAKGRSVVIMWGCVCLSVSIWGLGGVIASSASTELTAILGWKIAHVGTIIIPVVFFHFVTVYCHLKHRRLLFSMYLLAVVFLYYNFFQLNMFWGDVRFVFNQVFYIDWLKHKGIVYVLMYAIFYWLLLVYSFGLLVKECFMSKGLKRATAYLILSSSLGFLGAHGNFLSIFTYDVYPYSNFLIAIYCLIAGYAIVRYQLMDITLILTRTSIFIAVYSLVLGIPFGLTYWGKDYLLSIFGNNWYWIPLIVTTLFATVGPFLYLYIQRKAEDRLLKEQRAYQAALRQASLRMGQIKDFARLFELIIDVVTRAAKIEHVAIYLYEPAKRQYLCRASSKKDSSAFAQISDTEELFTYFFKNQESVVYDEIRQRSQDDPSQEFKGIESLMRGLNTSVVVPSFIENRLVAFFALGSKSAGKPFSEEDLAAFSILANQAALAIDNINSVEEMKKAQEKLFHAEKLAYVGQLASSIVHEVRNPLTAIKTFVNYLPEKYRSQDLEFLNRFESIIPGEIERIDKIVNELLDLAKPRRLKKKEIRVSEIVNRILESLKDNLQLKKIHVENQCLTQDDKIPCDEEQIQQVMLNLILNALDAMKEGGQLSVKIWREASTVGDRIMVTLKDTGCGIPQEQLKTLFTPFQTTKKEGVGLGLIITQEIVKLHGGEIQVESEIGRGTQFTVVLPVNN